MIKQRRLSIVSATRSDGKNRKLLSLVILGILTAAGSAPLSAHAAEGKFQVEEATIDDIHAAIKSGARSRYAKSLEVVGAH